MQTAELAQARGPEPYTLPDLVDFAGVRYEALDGEAEIAPDVWIIPTPGHTRGHQSLAARCTDRTVVLAGQAHDTATAFGADHLAWRARAEHVAGPLPDYLQWIDRVTSLDPRRVMFAHDQSVWEPATTPTA